MVWCVIYFFLAHVLDFDSFKEHDDTDLLFQKAYSALLPKVDSRNPQGSVVYKYSICRFKIVCVL